ncbi:MAG TPA: ATP-binding cassette domain-containing protein [Gaiellales bacterium]|nr:ATP-binding cassette domain-containing protein [Gaiellales bacterium]
MTDEMAVTAENLGKRFGERWVLRGVNLAVPRGAVLGLLGPNGAGKTTTVRILTTLLAPSEGRARVAGFDVVRDPARVRPRIGLAGQEATVDELLTGRANLEMVGRLSHLPRGAAGARAGDLLDTFALAEPADRLVKTYSGGMRRRLDLAVSLIASPDVLFLDEPTTGLDPRSRIDLWGLLRDLVQAGTTIVLTTQYLEEADRLADTVAVVDGGRIIASGTPAALKAQVGGRRIALTLHDQADVPPAVAALAPFGAGAPAVDEGQLTVTMPVAGGVDLVAIVRALDDAGVATADVALRGPTLDDVFLTLTGHDTHLEEAA